MVRVQETVLINICAVGSFYRHPLTDFRRSSAQAMSGVEDVIVRAMDARQSFTKCQEGKAVTEAALRHVTTQCATIIGGIMPL